MPWYQFNGSTVDNIGDPNQYSLVGSEPPSCPNPNDFLCAIQATDNNSKPTLTDINLIIEIANALQRRTESTNVLLKPTT